MTDKIKYYRAGHGNNVRGACHHKHRTIDAAAECCRRDQRDCSSIGGGAYSDRDGVYAVHQSGAVTGPYDDDQYVPYPY